MTREEAILWLKVINTKEFGWDEFALQESQRETRERCEQGVREAIDMAIEALSEVRCNDCKWNDDVIEVVRCKDCRQYIPHDLTDDYGWCCEFKTPIEEDDFCSHGERKGE